MLDNLSDYFMEKKMLKVKDRMIFLGRLSAIAQGRLAIFVSGFTMLMVQVLLLRELTSLYVVNELIVGVFLSFWLLFAGAGAFTASRFRSFNVKYSGIFPLLTGVSAYFSLWMLYLVKGWLIPGGVPPGLWEWLVMTAVITFVFCFPAGMLFTWFSASLSQISQRRQTESVYVFEQLGSLVAGLLFSLVAVLWLDAFSAISFLFLINVLVSLILIAPIKGKIFQMLSVLGVFAILLMIFLPQYNFAKEKVLERPVRQTFFSPYGSIDVLGNKETSDFFGKGQFFSDQLRPENIEEALHPALLLHPDPQRLLMVNVGVGLLSEALKYKRLQVDFISPDGARIEIEKILLAQINGLSSRVRFIQDDPVRYLSRQQDDGYDVVLIGGGVPDDLASTRFFTTEFLSEVKRNMRGNGLLVTGGIDYPSLEDGQMTKILNILKGTIKTAFPHVRIWSGNKLFFVASQHEIRAGWYDFHPEVIARNQFLNATNHPPLYLKQKRDRVEASIMKEGPVNTRIKPVLFRMALQRMGSILDMNMTWLVGVLSVLVLIGLLVFRASSKGVFMSGFVLGGMQVAILLFWQLVMGDLYRATGILFSLFMAGLVLGGIMGKRQIFIFRARYFPALLISMGLVSEIALPLLGRLAEAWIFPFVVFAVVMMLAILGGGIFVVGLSMVRGRVEQSAALTYVADVAGGALGFFLTAIFLVPYSGLVNTGYLLGMGLLMGGVLLIKKT